MRRSRRRERTLAYKNEYLRKSVYAAKGGRVDWEEGKKHFRKGMGSSCPRRGGRILASKEKRGGEGHVRKVLICLAGGRLGDGLIRRSNSNEWMREGDVKKKGFGVRGLVSVRRKEGTTSILWGRKKNDGLHSLRERKAGKKKDSQRFLRKKKKFRWPALIGGKRRALLFKLPRRRKAKKGLTIGRAEGDSFSFNRDG